jgi:hypothetical protein
MEILVDEKKLADLILSVKKAGGEPINTREVLELAIRESASEVQNRIIKFLCKRCRGGQKLTRDMQKEYAHLDHPGGIFHRCGAAGLLTLLKVEVD